MMYPGRILFVGFTQDAERTAREAFEAVLDGKFEQSALDVVFTFDFFDSRLNEFLNMERPVLFIGILWSKIALGPLQIRGRTTCLDCLRYWMTIAGSWECGVDNLDPKSTIIAVDVSAEAIREFSGSGTIAGAENGLTLIDPISFERIQHAIPARKNCRSCSDLHQHQVVQLDAYCSPFTGIIRELHQPEGMIHGVHVASSLFASPLRAKGASAGGLRCSFGRGRSDREARDSCIGEALEQFSATYRGTEVLCKGTIARTGGVDPRTISLYSERQYSTRRIWNRTAVARHSVPDPFDDERSIDWARGWDLMDLRTVLLPAACCFIQYQFAPGEPAFVQADAVGCGTGASLADALLTGMLEWIERDATAIWWYNQLSRPEVAIESFGDPDLERVQRAFERDGRRLVILDVTSDIGIPSYVAVATKFDGTGSLFGAATHHSARVAAWKAASEVAQFSFAIDSCGTHPEFQSWLTSSSIVNHPYLQPSSVVEAPNPSLYSTPAERLSDCITKLRSVGLRSLAVNLSRPDVVPKTVRVFVPGLRHLCNRRAPGRLYDVPVQKGWLDKARMEEEINPVCCVF